jgi:hypothetical protein
MGRDDLHQGMLQNHSTEAGHGKPVLMSKQDAPNDRELLVNFPGEVLLILETDLPHVSAAVLKKADVGAKGSGQSVQRPQKTHITRTKGASSAFTRIQKCRESMACSAERTLGDLVLIHSLKTHAEWNGEIGVICSLPRERGRYQVAVRNANGTEVFILVKKGNILLAEAFKPASDRFVDEIFDVAMSTIVKNTLELRHRRLLARTPKGQATEAPLEDIFPVENRIVDFDRTSEGIAMRMRTLKYPELVYASFGEELGGSPRARGGEGLGRRDSIDKYIDVLQSEETESTKAEMLTAFLRREERREVLQIFTEAAMWSGEGESAFFESVPTDWSGVVAALRRVSSQQYNLKHSPERRERLQQLHNQLKEAMLDERCESTLTFFDDNQAPLCLRMAVPSSLNKIQILCFGKGFPGPQGGHSLHELSREEFAEISSYDNSFMTPGVPGTRSAAAHFYGFLCTCLLTLASQHVQPPLLCVFSMVLVQHPLPCLSSRYSDTNPS